jgi:hypothetical protein
MPLPQDGSRRNSSKVLPRSLVFRTPNAGTGAAIQISAACQSDMGQAGDKDELIRQLPT